MTKDEAFNSFHQWLTFRNYAKGTVTDYLYNFKIFSESIPPDFDYSELTHQHAIDFVFKIVFCRSVMIFNHHKISSLLDFL